MFAVDFAAVRAHVRDVVAAVEPQDFARALQWARRTGLCRRGPSSTDAETVAVNGYDVKARRFVIATRSLVALSEQYG